MGLYARFYAYSGKFKPVSSDGTANITNRIIEAEWHRVTDGVGDFSIYMLAKDFKELDALGWTFVVRSQIKQGIGIIQKVTYSADKEGKFVTVQGQMCECMLDWAQTVLPITIMHESDKSYKYYNKGFLYQAFDQLAFSLRRISSTDRGNTSLRPFGYNRFYGPYFENGAKDYTTKNAVHKYGPGEGYGDIIRELLAVKNYFVRVYVDYYDSSDIFNGLTLMVYICKRRDKSTQIVFSESKKNISQVSYSIDESKATPAIFSYAMIPRKGNKDAWEAIKNKFTISNPMDYRWDSLTDRNPGMVGIAYSYTKNNPGRIPKSKPFKVIGLADNDVKLEDTSDAGVARIKTFLKTAADNASEEYGILTDIDVTVDPNGYEYINDYDLGDICTVKIETIGVSAKASIMEITETYKDNHQEISLGLGNINETSRWRQKRSNADEKVNALSTRVAGNPVVNSKMVIETVKISFPKLKAGTSAYKSAAIKTTKGYKILGIVGISSSATKGSASIVDYGIITKKSKQYVKVTVHQGYKTTGKKFTLSVKVLKKAI